MLSMTPGAGTYGAAIVAEGCSEAGVGQGRSLFLVHHLLGKMNPSVVPERGQQKSSRRH